MDLRAWDARYRSAQRPEDLETAPTPLLVETAQHLAPGKALDLACGAGRNALWLAAQGWYVTAVDGSPAAIDILKQRAARRSITLEACVADLQEFSIAPAAWDLIVMSYYLQRNLFEPVKRGVVPGGIVLAIVHITEPGEEHTYKRLRPGELPGYFSGCEILHSYEGKPADPAHQRSVAEIVARRPA